MYAVTSAEHPPPSSLGIEDAPLRPITAGRVAAMASDLDAPVRTTEDALWRHEAVVEELMRAGAALPMRFGSVLADDEAARGTLREREEQLTAGLGHVRGAVELGVRVLWDPGSEAGPAPSGEQRTEDAGAGTAYLMRRLGHTRRSHDLANEVHEPLAGLARDSTRRLLVTPRLLLSGSYLVDDEAVGEFRTRIEELDDRLGDLAIICTGPWPPYSFVPSEATG